jgi:hypothetical protein
MTAASWTIEAEISADRALVQCLGAPDAETEHLGVGHERISRREEGGSSNPSSPTTVS